MNCQLARESFAELLDCRTPPTGHLEVRAHLANCPECQRAFAALAQPLDALDRMSVAAPSPRLRQAVYAMIEEEKHSAASVRAAGESISARRSAPLWQWIVGSIGACALVAVGYLAGSREPARVAPPAVAMIDPELKRELQALREKVEHMETMNQLVAASFQPDQRPANDRLVDILASAADANSNEGALNLLISSLALDSSANVRLRALESLYPHADRDVVRASVLASLPREANPLVQVAMIDFLAAARDVEAKPALERLAANLVADTNVREAAKCALAQL